MVLSIHGLALLLELVEQKLNVFLLLFVTKVELNILAS